MFGVCTTYSGLDKRSLECCGIRLGDPVGLSLPPSCTKEGMLNETVCVRKGVVSFALPPSRRCNHLPLIFSVAVPMYACRTK